MGENTEKSVTDLQQWREGGSKRGDVGLRGRGRERRIKGEVRE